MWQNTGREFLFVRNKNSADVWATVRSFWRVAASAPLHDLKVRIYKGSRGYNGVQMFGPFPPYIFNDANGYAHVSWTGSVYGENIRYAHGWLVRPALVDR